MQRIIIIQHGKKIDLDFNEIYFNYNKLCKSIAFENIDRFNEYDDLISITNLSLFKAFNTYNVDKKTSFSTYLYKLCQNDLQMNKRQNKKKSKESSLELFFDSEKEDKSFNNYSKSYINNMINFLTLEERQLVILYFFYGYKQKEIAILKGISRSYTSRLLTNILLKIKENEKNEY
jgi:RNA polymerase sigma factor (sigma-70 family)